MSRSSLVARNVLVTLTTQLLSWCLAFMVTIYVPRYLKDTGLGAMTLAGAFATVFSLMVGLGMSTVLVKEVARDRSRAGTLLLTALVIRLPLCLLAVVSGWMAASLLGYHPYLRTLMMIALAAMALGQLNDILMAVMRGLEDFPRLSALMLMEKTLGALLLIGLVFRRAAWWTFIAAPMIGAVISLLVGTNMLRPSLRSMRWPRREEIIHLMRAGLPFWTNAIFIAIYGQSDALLLSKLSGVAAIGWYGLVQRLAGVTMVIPTALTGAMLPTLSRLHVEDQAAFNRAIRRLCNLMLICVVPISALLILASGRILILLHYPSSFQGSVPSLIITGVSIVLWFLSQAVGIALVASDRQGIFSRITGIAALLSVPLCSLCIYITQRLYANGAIGAVCSDTILEIYLLASYLRALPGGVISWKSATVMGRAIVAVLPFVCLFWMLGGRSSLYLPLLGLVLYLPLCWSLRCFDPQDIQMIYSAFRRGRRQIA